MRYIFIFFILISSNLVNSKEFIFVNHHTYILIKDLLGESTHKLSDISDQTKFNYLKKTTATVVTPPTYLDDRFRDISEYRETHGLPSVKLYMPSNLTKLYKMGENVAPIKALSHFWLFPEISCSFKQQFNKLGLESKMKIDCYREKKLRNQFNRLINKRLILISDIEEIYPLFQIRKVPIKKTIDNKLRKNNFEKTFLKLFKSKFSINETDGKDPYFIYKKLIQRLGEL